MRGAKPSQEINILDGQTGGCSPTEFQVVSGHLSNHENGLPVVVAEWQRNKRETLRVSLDRYYTHVCVDVRSWWRNKDGVLQPGKSGLTLAVKHLPELAAALVKALEVAKELGLHDEADR